MPLVSHHCVHSRRQLIKRVPKLITQFLQNKQWPFLCIIPLVLFIRLKKSKTPESFLTAVITLKSLATSPFIFFISSNQCVSIISTGFEMQVSDVGSNHSANFAKALGGSHGLVVIWGDSCPESRGFESHLRILDGHFSHVCLKNCNVFLKRQRKTKKRPGMTYLTPGSVIKSQYNFL